MGKMIEDISCSQDLALSWVLNAKNSLKNVTGFSQFQLALKNKKKFPYTLLDELPTLNMKLTSQGIQEKPNAIHTAW